MLVQQYELRDELRNSTHTIKELLSECRQSGIMFSFFSCNLTCKCQGDNYADSRMDLLK